MAETNRKASPQEGQPEKNGHKKIPNGSLFIGKLTTRSLFVNPDKGLSKNSHFEFPKKEPPSEILDPAAP